MQPDEPVGEKKRKPRGRPRVQSRAARSPRTRLKLIEAATDSIIERGYSRTTLGEVAKRAGVTKGMHVYLFRNKLDLMANTINHLFEQVRRETSQLDFEGPLSRQTIEQTLQQIAQTMLSKSGIALFEVWMASRTDPELRAVFSAIETKNATERRRVLTDRFGHALMESTDLMVLFEGLILILRGLALQKVLDYDTLESKTWLWWRKKLADDIFSSIESARGGGPLP